MKIPLAYEEMGYFYKIGDNCYFIQYSLDRNNMYNNPKYRKGTWREFIETYPNTVCLSGACVRYRKK